MSGYLYDAVETAIIEQRAYPRFAVDEPAYVNGVGARVRNISRSGVQVACPRDEAERLPPALEGVALDVVLVLGGRRAEVIAEAVYACLDGEQLVLGMRYLDDGEAGRGVVHTYVDDVEVRQAPL